ncbi:hypothetical protein ABZY58_11340 [Micromonospora tulbaghiae]|uniref:hypothetical protein n=1 Tax=Micromonospora tulbaghiae TaxID=479978 RepID=UPI00339F2395
MPQTLPALLNDVQTSLALHQFTREEAIARLTADFDITERGAADLLDNGIQTESTRWTGIDTAPWKATHG